MINNEKTKIQRNFGIDLLRIISMINIINLHINLFSGLRLLHYNYSKYKEIWRLETFSFWSVDCFGIISGIVGYKRYKFSNLIYLWFLVWFYSLGISLYLYFINKEIKKMTLFLHCFPILIKRHWYVNAYFSMYLLLPFINYGIESLNIKTFRNLIIFFFCFYSIYNLFATIIGNNNHLFLMNGFSSMWLTILYIIGAYFGKYIIKKENDVRVRYYIIYFLIYICSSFTSSEVYLKLFKIKSKIPKKLLISYLSPTMLLQAISLIMIFGKLTIQNKLIIKIISFITPLNFSAQLIHARLFQTKIKIIINFFNWIKNFKSNKLFFKIYALSFLIYFFCIIIDYLRFLLFKLCKVRKICLYIEKNGPKIIDKLILYFIKIKFS